MKELYEKNFNFREYVDRYCVQHKVTVDEALTHALVKDVAAFYSQA